LSEVNCLHCGMRESAQIHKRKPGNKRRGAVTAARRFHELIFIDEGVLRR